MSHKMSRSRAYWRTVFVALALFILTLIEFYVALNYNKIALLMFIATIKAILVLYFFMHVYRLWSPEEEH